MAKLDTLIKIGVLVAAMAALMALTIWGAIWVSHAETRKAEAAFPKCQGKHASHEAVIQDDKVKPQHTEAKRCDTLTIINMDDQDRIVAFGQHDRHVAYDGVTERYLNHKGTFTVTLIQPGNFRFHDHEQDKVQGTFTVKP